MLSSTAADERAAAAALHDAEAAIEVATILAGPYEGRRITRVRPRGGSP